MERGTAMADASHLFLEFFSEQFAVAAPTGQLADLRFLFGPHVVADSQSPGRLRVEFTTPDEYLVRRSDGTTLLRRTFRDWGNVPPPVPPFAALRGRYRLLPAVVLAKGGATVALVGGPGGQQAGTGFALAQLGWRFVSGRLLVVDRTTGQTLPYLAPLELRGEIRESVAARGLPRGTARARRSTLSGEVLLVRPEAAGGAVPVGARLAPPRVVRLCRGTGEAVRLVTWNRRAQTWPVVDGTEDVDGAGTPDEPDWDTYRLELTPAGGVEEAACLIDQQWAPEGDTIDTTEKERACPAVPDTDPARPAGLTVSLPI
ncbi:hypothetical protein [Streptomyces sp. NPDC005408]|uniref:hypothetical protein n=1 Tax=Streptomyces sp. NPDC005408 TaxID=3155341 RepID=UPI0033BE19C2